MALFARLNGSTLLYWHAPAFAQPELSGAIVVIENRAIVSRCSSARPRELKIAKTDSPVEHVPAAVWAAGCATEIAEAAARFRDIVAEHGGDKIFYYGGGGQGNHLGGGYGAATSAALGSPGRVAPRPSR